MSEESTAAELDELLAFIRDSRGFDFTGYKRTTLERRLRKRMEDAQINSLTAYRDRLETDANEFTRLFDTVLINVTSFFRDVEAWKHLNEEVLPQIIKPGQEIRVWSAGCSTGEEAYTLAMMFAEAMGLQAFNDCVKIYATDVDDKALAQARKGIYTQRQLEPVSADLQERYFEPNGVGKSFRSDLRRRIIFGRLDLASDAPISGLDLLVCRNTLMYFNAETQRQILSRLHFAVQEGGLLFLGKAEMLMANGARFVPESMAHRIFRRRPGAAQGPGPLAPADVARALSNEALRHRQLREMALETDSAARLLVDVEGNTVVVNNQARAIFGLTSRDEGRPLRDLELSYRPVELRSLIEQSQAERRIIRLNAVERPLGPNDVQFLDLLINPIIAHDGVILGTMVTFVDATAYVRLQQEVKTSREELETAYEELQSTNEELETTNEELQSTNEELETTNEEMRSTNNELESMNDELSVRSSELDERNAYFSGVVASVPIGVVVLDHDLRVRSWNLVVEDLWGMRSDEALGRPFFGLDLGLPTGPLREPVRQSLDGAASIGARVEAVNRRGQRVVCTVTCSPLGDSTAGVVLLMEAERVEHEGAGAEGM